MAVVYVVDGDASVRTALVRLITSEKMPVQAYASGQEFAEAVRPTDSDCVVIDVEAAGMSGLELLVQLRRSGVDAPLILLARRDDEKTRARAHRLGAAGYLLKPVDGQALLDTVRFVLNRADS